ncbi:MAG: UbiA family prenyltransferase [Flavobacteriaceae bacterium]|jgi:4-hydroxybenzoate polyprenyltransferase|nr:UbiA family prenyltransferase [Flavobacteriaceae bacterium]
MTTRRFFLLKNLSLLFKVRIANIFMLVLSMYLSAVFLFDEKLEIINSLKNIKLHGIVISSTFSAMAGYIINYFYDKDKDRIYRPISTVLQRFINDKSSLNFYIAFNIISLTVALFLSYRIFIFFLVYHFFIWFYSHKLSRIVIINNITCSILMTFPFLALFLFYENYAPYILFLALFLFIIILIRDICKDLHSSKYDALFGYKTLPNTLGIGITKMFLDILLFLLALISVRLTLLPHLQEIRLYYMLSAFLSLFMMVEIWFMEKRLTQLFILMIKFWIFIGTISLLFIDGNPLPLYFQK